MGDISHAFFCDSTWIRAMPLPSAMMLVLDFWSIICYYLRKLVSCNYGCQVGGKKHEKNSTDNPNFSDVPEC